MCKPDTIEHLYLDELERRARCRRSELKGRTGGCKAPMRLLLCSHAETHAFQAEIGSSGTAFSFKPPFAKVGR